MSGPKLAAMLRDLSRYGYDYNAERAAVAGDIIGRQIVALDLGDSTLRIALDDGRTLVLRDEGQQCCESRYMRTDDDLPSFVGSTLVDVEEREAPNNEEDHEVIFIAVRTSGGDLVLSSHNEHNGYYGGFDIEATIEVKQ